MAKSKKVKKALEKEIHPLDVVNHVQSAGVATLWKDFEISPVLGFYLNWLVATKSLVDLLHSNGEEIPNALSKVTKNKHAASIEDAINNILDRNPDLADTLAEDFGGAVN